MKRFITLLLTLALCLPMWACGDSGQTKEEKIPTIKTGEKIQLSDDLSFKIVKISYQDDALIRGLDFTPGNGETFCVIECVLYNEGRKTLSLSRYGGVCPEIDMDYDNGYDSHYFKAEWEYGTSTYIVPELEAQKSKTIKFYADIPDVQVNDKSSSKVISVSYQGREFQLKLQ